MIFLTKGQILKDNPGIVVYDPTGYYNDGDSVICASIAFPDEPVCRYEAKFVAYGGIVYSISNEDDLMAEVIKLDPASLFGKDSQQVAVDKMVENIVPQESGEIVEEATTEVVEPVDTETDTLPETTPLEETIEASEIINSASSTAPVAPIPDTTPLSDASTTTPTEVTPAPLPEIEQAIETMTSTESGVESP